VLGIDAGMFFEAIMGDIFLNNLFRVQVVVEFKRLSVFIKFAFRRIMFISGFPDFTIADRSTDGFNESGIDGSASLIVKPWDSNWRRISELI
jgi:hypothetical protein